jgi:hypothetical protein
MPRNPGTITRAPVLTLRAQEEGLTLCKAVAGLNAQSKGRRLGIFEEPKGAQEDKERKVRQPEETSSVQGA